ncbi:hypothetical protein ALQ06_00802 [Pseudomonas syringae pv. berberidis]|nr:hypothetical protein ALQ06_00802 [Pseudomonas syringae pv. berberidis]
MPGDGVRLFAIETGQTRNGLGSVMMAIRRVGDVSLLARITRVQHTVVPVTGDQGRSNPVVVTILLSQQVTACTDKCPLRFALQLGHQSLAVVKSPGDGLSEWRQRGHAVQRVISVGAEESHDRSLMMESGFSVNRFGMRGYCHKCQ